MIKGLTTVEMAYDWVAVCIDESVTVSANVEVTAAVAVETPVALVPPKVRPAGSCPLVTAIV
jgi:hypothetical protein